MMIFLLLAIGDISEQAGGQTQLTCDGAKAAGETEKKEGEITGGKVVIALEALSWGRMSAGLGVGCKQGGHGFVNPVTAI